MALTTDYVRSIEDLAKEHGIDPPEPLPKKKFKAVSEEEQLLKEEVRLLKEQRDTVARQWMRQNITMEVLSRTCLYCDFVAQTRTSLKTHMRSKHSLG